MLGKFTVPLTKGDAGRKIDTWKFSFPDEKTASIDVSLRSDHKGLIFLARSSHPLLRKIEWRHSDIQVLRERVKQDIEDVVAETTGDQWKAAYTVQLKLYKSKRDANHVQIEFQTEPVMLDTSAPRSNRGERAVLKNGSPISVIEVGFGENLKRTYGGAITPETMREMRFHEGTPVARCVVEQSPETTAASTLIEATLTAFAAYLGKAVGPDRADPEKLPTPEDLVRFMELAARDVQS